MNPRTRIYIAIPLVLIGLFMAWYFQAIIIYVLLAVVVSFIGRPMMKLLQTVRIRQYHLPNALSAALTLLIIYLFISALFSILIPAIGKQAQVLSQLEPEVIIERLQEPLEGLQHFAMKYKMYNRKEEIVQYLEQEIIELVQNFNLPSFFNAVGEVIGNIFIAIFSITFISFFFLKESRLFHDIVLTLTPSGFESRVDHILDTVKPLLTRYFLGVLLEVLLVGSLISLGLWIVGVDNALLIGFASGFLNVIPYLGPVIGAVLGLALALVGQLDIPLYPDLLFFLLKVAMVYTVVQVMDNLIFQPMIYSSSVKAHPLEIFLVILMAGSFAGIPGMVMAIPVYTIVRVVAKEFLSEFKVVKSITKGI